VKKLCGYKEKCFINGEKYWGHMGYCLCLYASERKKIIGKGNISICGKDNKKVNYYN
jgi:hypothetical protein